MKYIWTYWWNIFEPINKNTIELIIGNKFEPIDENKILPGINLIILNGKIILAISGIEVNVFSRRTAPILSLFWDLNQPNKDVFWDLNQSNKDVFWDLNQSYKDVFWDLKQSNKDVFDWPVFLYRCVKLRMLKVLFFLS